MSGPSQRCKLLTVDVWDTLLRRKCHPDAVKLETARTLIIRHGEQLYPMYRDSWALLDLRFRIEGELARAAAANPEHDDEYSLRDVLTAWVTRASMPPAVAPAQVVETLEAEEFEHEHFVCYVDGGIRRQLESYTAERTLFLSDFYMPAKNLHALLEAKGLVGLFDGGHSSCDHRLNKRSGRLFGLMHRLYGVEPHQHVHIGDNAWSDYESPKRLAIQSAHYVFAEEERLREQRKSLFLGRRQLFDAIEAECMALARSTTMGRPAEAFELGVALAPLFVGFVLFVMESVQRDRAGKLFFFSREGEFFIKVYEVLRGVAPRVERAAPAGRLLEVSRLATFAASLEGISPAEMMRLWNLYSTQSMKAWASSLGLPAEAAAEWCGKHGIEFAQPLKYPWQDARVVALFQDPQIVVAMQGFIADKKALLLDYLSGKGLSVQDDSVAFVDIGWRGTIQDNIALLLPRTRVHGYYMGLQKFLNPQPENGAKNAFGPDLNLSPDGAALFGNLPLIEMVSNSPHGSTIGYRRMEDGSVVSMRFNDEAEDRVFHDYISHIQDGVMLAARVWAEQIHVHAISAVELRQRSLERWRQLVATPAPIVSRALSALQHNEMFGLGEFVDKGKGGRRFSLHRLLGKVS